MKRNTVFNLDLTEINLHPSSRTEALETLVGRLYKFGYVNESYCQQVIQREKEFPTGLAFEHITVALPHANPEDVLQSACVIGKCHSPIPFGSMEAPEKELPVELILVLALNNPNAHLNLLSQLMSLFSDEERVKAIRAANSNEELCKIFMDYFDQ